MTHVVLSLGTNINRAHNLSGAVNAIRTRFGKIVHSPVYETSSVGFEGPPFLNLVLGFDSRASLAEIRSQLHEIESAAGRVRGPKSFSSRTLDIDIILFGHFNLRDKGFNIPRDEIEKYAYVLKPLSDLYPDLPHPVRGRTMIDLWHDFKLEGQTLTVVDFRL